jgi:hypothetical protein
MARRCDNRPDLLPDADQRLIAALNRIYPLIDEWS